MGRYPWAEFILFELLHAIALYPTHQRAYQMVVFAAMTYVAAQIYLKQEATDSVAVAWSLSVTIAFYLGRTAYVLFAEGPFPDHWRRVRDEVHAKADAGGSDVLPSNFPWTEATADDRYRIRFPSGWLGPGTTKLFAATPTTLASDVPQEDHPEAHHLYHHV